MTQHRDDDLKHSPTCERPGVYTNGVLTANVVDGAIVPIPEATP